MRTMCERIEANAMAWQSGRRHTFPNLFPRSYFILTEANAFFLFVSSQFGRTPLYAAAKGQHLDCLKLLLAAGADAKKETKNNWEPMDMAKDVACKQLLQEAIDNGGFLVNAGGASTGTGDGEGPPASGIIQVPISIKKYLHHYHLHFHFRAGLMTLFRLLLSTHEHAMSRGWVTLDPHD